MDYILSCKNRKIGTTIRKMYTTIALRQLFTQSMGH